MHEVIHRSFGRPDANDQAQVVNASPAVEAETTETEESFPTNAPEGVDEAPMLPVDEATEVADAEEASEGSDPEEIPAE